MKTRLDIYNNLCAFLSNNAAETTVYEDEDAIRTYFKNKDQICDYNPSAETFKKYLDFHGYTKPFYVDFVLEKHKVQPYYTSIRAIFDKKKQKISLSAISCGWKWSYTKKRYYPFSNTWPIVTLSNTLYTIVNKTKTKPSMVRVYQGYNVDPKIIQILCDIPYVPSDLPGVTYRSLIGTSNPIEALEKKHETKIPKLLTKLLNTVELSIMCQVVEPNYMNKLCQYAIDITKEGDIFIDEQPGNLPKILMRQFGGNNMGYNTGIIYDHMHQLMRLKKKMNLKIKSFKRLVQEHYQDSKLLMLRGVKAIKPDEKYRNLLDGLQYPYEFVDTKERLVEESVSQHHCVATYADKINKGYCGIYSIDYAGKKWTLELEPIGNEERFLLRQLRGDYNSNAPKELFEAIGNLPKIVNEVYPTVAVAPPEYEPINAAIEW